jgi:hypothetical protein
MHTASPFTVFTELTLTGSSQQDSSNLQAAHIIPLSKPGWMKLPIDMNEHRNNGMVLAKRWHDAFTKSTARPVLRVNFPHLELLVIRIADDLDQFNASIIITCTKEIPVIYS